MSEMRTLMEMLWELEFYRDVLYHHEYGAMINSQEFSGTPGETAVQKVNEWLEEQGIGKAAVNYRLRDWLISRQRYWGTPIPIIHCPEHGLCRFQKGICQCCCRMTSSGCRLARAP